MEELKVARPAHSTRCNMMIKSVFEQTVRASWWGAGMVEMDVFVGCPRGTYLHAKGEHYSDNILLLLQ